MKVECRHILKHERSDETHKNIFGRYLNHKSPNRSEIYIVRKKIKSRLGAGMKIAIKKLPIDISQKKIAYWTGYWMQTLREFMP